MKKMLMIIILLLLTNITYSVFSEQSNEIIQTGTNDIEDILEDLPSIEYKTFPIDNSFSNYSDTNFTVIFMDMSLIVRGTINHDLDKYEIIFSDNPNIAFSTSSPNAGLNATLTISDGGTYNYTGCENVDGFENPTGGRGLVFTNVSTHAQLYPNILVEEGGLFNWECGEIKLSGAFGIYGNLSVRNGIADFDVFNYTQGDYPETAYKLRDWGTNANVEIDNLEIINGLLALQNVYPSVEGLVLTQSQGIQVPIQANKSLFHPFKDFTGKRGNLYDIKYTDTKIRITNSDTGSDLIYDSHFDGAGLVEVRKEVTFDIKDIDDNPIENVRYFIPDYNNSNRTDYTYDSNISNVFIDVTDEIYVNDFRYTGTTNSSGEALEDVLTFVLTKNVRTDGNTSNRNHPDHVKFDYRSKNNGTDDVFDIFLWDYNHRPVFLSNLEFKQIRPLNIRWTLFDDTDVTETDSTVVAAYEGIAIDHSTDTITVTENHTINEIYDYIKYDKTLAANIDLPSPNTLAASVNGNELVLNSYNLVVDNATINQTDKFRKIRTDQLITLTNGGVIDAIREDRNGLIVKLVVSNLAGGETVRIEKVSDGQEIFNGVVAGTEVSVDYLYSENEQAIVMIRTRQQGKLPESTTVMITNNGFVLPVSLETDTIYEDIGIEGSSVTEFELQQTPLRILINDSDNQTTMQRLYAWWSYATATEDNIGNYDADDFEALTILTFKSYDGLKLKNVNSNPLTISGGNFEYDGGIPSDIIDGTGSTIIVASEIVVPFQTSLQQATEQEFLNISAAVGPMHDDGDQVTLYITTTDESGQLVAADVNVNITYPNLSELSAGSPTVESVGVFRYITVLPANSPPGDYRIIIDATHGDEQAHKVLIFDVLEPGDVLIDTHDAVIRVEGAITNLQTVLTNINILLTNLQGSVNSLPLISDITTSTRNELTNVLNNLTSITTTLNTISGNVDTFGNDLDTINTNLNTILGVVNTINTKADTITVTINNINTTVNDINTLSQTISTATQTIIESYDCDDTADTPICESIDNLTTDVSDLDTKVDTLTTNVADIDTDIVTLTDKTDNLTTDVADIDSDIVSLDTDISNLDTKLDTVKTDTDSIISTIASINTNVQALSELHNCDDTDDSDICELVDDLTTDVSNLDDKIDTLTTDVSDIDTDLVSITTTLNTVLTVVNSINTKADTITTTVNAINALSQTINTTTQNIVEFHECDDTDNSDICELVDNLITDVSNLDDKIVTLTTNVADIDSDIVSLDTDLTDLDTDVSNLDTKLDTITTSTTSIITTIGTINTNVQELSESNNCDGTDDAAVCGLIDDLTTDISDIDEKVDDLTDDVADIDSDIISLNTGLTTGLATSTQSLSTLLNNINTSIGNLRDLHECISGSESQICILLESIEDITSGIDIITIESFDIGSPIYPNENIKIKSVFTGVDGSVIEPDEIELIIYSPNGNVWQVEGTEVNKTKDDFEQVDNVWQYIQSVPANPVTGSYNAHLTASYNSITTTKSTTFRIASGGPYRIALNCPQTGNIGGTLSCQVDVIDEGEVETESIITVWIDKNNNGILDSQESTISLSKETRPQQVVSETVNLNIPSTQQTGIYLVRLDVEYVNSAQPNSNASDSVEIISSNRGSGGSGSSSSGGSGGSRGSTPAIEQIVSPTENENVSIMEKSEIIVYEENPTYLYIIIGLLLFISLLLFIIIAKRSKKTKHRRRKSKKKRKKRVRK